MNILFCSAEVAPFAKTGGLGDVSGALPLALGKMGHHVLIATPQFAGQAGQRLVRLAPNVRVIFIEHPEYFHRKGIYVDARGKDYADNAARFAFLCHQALREARNLNFRPDIVHAHDWHTAPLPMILKTLHADDPFFRNTRSVFTIHNLAYQGIFPASQFSELGIGKAPAAFKKCSFWGKISYMKAGLEFADRINAVSPGYMREILTKKYGCGLDHVLRRRRRSTSGILNGIDVDTWNPATDKALPRPFSASRPEGRAASRAKLLRTMGLEDDGAPVFGIVSRLAEQKGIDILMRGFGALMKRGVKLVVLGTGEKKYEDFFRKAQKRHPRQVACILQFAGAEASLIYAGSDFFLMPSRFEPCGLGQLISFRYGTIPVVHRTGGLADTVIDADADPKRGNGFVFDRYEAPALLKAVDRAIRLHANPRREARVRQIGMNSDFSWKLSARKYEALYRKALAC